MLSLGRLSRTNSVRIVGTRQLHVVKDFGYDVKRGVEPVCGEEVATLHYNYYLSLVDKLNKAIKDTADEDLNAHRILLKYPDTKPIYDLAAEIVNHEIMWFSTKPGGVPPSEKMNTMLNIQFGGLHRFEQLWKSRAVAIHGSGWMWLVSDYSQLEISYGFNAGTPKPPVIGLLCMDVWEHAYFTQYGSDRKAYVEQFLKAINWDFIEKVITKLYPDRDFTHFDREEGQFSIYYGDVISELFETLQSDDEEIIAALEGRAKEPETMTEERAETLRTMLGTPDTSMEEQTSVPPSWAKYE